jgi:hypothetical protein
MRYPPKERIESSLSGLFEILASPLIQLGITPARISDLIKNSFVKAGTTIVRKKHSGRPHIAKLAAITGLTRLEVRRIVEANYAVRPASIETAPRTLRVLEGWKTDKRYSKRGKPFPLSLAGTAPSFQSLCKKYSGDIPHTAILAELQSQGLAQLTKADGRPMVTASPKPMAANLKNANQIKFAASVLRTVQIASRGASRTQGRRSDKRERC